MFTGLVEQLASITEIATTKVGREIRLACTYNNLTLGESISVNGVCLTVLDFGSGWFTVAAMVMTMGRTTVGDWRVGQRVNLERAMRGDSRFGGHIVQGHVDGVGVVQNVRRETDALLIDVSVPLGLTETLVLQGSVALDGVSLTVNRLESDKLQVALIDYTVSHTSLADIAEGTRVNVETDVIGKHVQRLVAPYLNR